MAHRPHVVVVGSGAAGLGAAWQLSRRCRVTLVEADDRIGGHANTQRVDTPAGPVDVDTGFIVHNRTTYPQLVRLFEELDVPTQRSDMTMSVSCAGCGLEYAGGAAAPILDAIRRRPSSFGLFREIRRFQVRASRDLETGIDPAMTLDDYATSIGMSPRARSHFLVPFTAAVWTAPPGAALDMPADSILGFCQNHGILAGPRVRWRTVTGGSTTYVQRLLGELTRRDVTVLTSAPVSRIVRDADGDHPRVRVELAAGDVIDADHVVVATHPDQALPLLDAPTRIETDVLGPWRYTSSDTVLHTDARLLPRARTARACWNYRLPSCDGHAGPPTLTYSMNRLQRFDAGGAELLVSLNSTDAIDPDSILYRVQYAHPQYDLAARAAQQRVPELHATSADTGTTYAGAWQANGFHEDAMASGIAAAEVALRVLVRHAVHPDDDVDRVGATA